MTTLQEWEAWTSIWPVAEKTKAVAPVRVGMDRRTGKMLTGWQHVEQSLEMLFATRFHERILREWAGSFVPHLLGENITGATINRFWWAIISACDLWEPDYAIKQIFLRNALGSPEFANPTNTNGIRRGDISFAYQGVYMPRGHLGDNTPETSVASDMTSRGDGVWRVSATL